MWRKLHRYKSPGIALLDVYERAIEGLRRVRGRFEARHNNGGLAINTHRRTIQFKGGELLHRLRQIVWQEPLFGKYVASRGSCDEPRVHDGIQFRAVARTYSFKIITAANAGTRQVVLPFQ